VERTFSGLGDLRLWGCFEQGNVVVVAAVVVDGVVGVVDDVGGVGVGGSVGCVGCGVVGCVGGGVVVGLKGLHILVALHVTSLNVSGCE